MIVVGLAIVCLIVVMNLSLNMRGVGQKRPLPLVERRSTEDVRDTARIIYLVERDGALAFRRVRAALDNKLQHNHTTHTTTGEQKLVDLAEEASVDFVNAPFKQYYDEKEKDEPGECKPFDWQTKSFPTCNPVHEIDLMSGVGSDGRDVKILGAGGVRLTWRVPDWVQQQQQHCEALAGGAALKTLRHVSDRSFTPFMYEVHRRDAVATERLSSSPNVVNMHAFCGQSVVNAMFSSTLKKGMRKNEYNSVSKLRFARDAANAFRTAHNSTLGTIIHGDVTASNFAISADGSSLVLHDFNRASFLSRNNVTKSACGYRHQQCTSMRSPEECKSGAILSEKTDVYALGHVLYYILTKHLPYRYPKRLSSTAAHKAVREGVTPALPPEIRNSTDEAIFAVRGAMKDCYAHDAKLRPSARQIWMDLNQALSSISKRVLL